MTSSARSNRPSLLMLGVLLVASLWMLLRGPIRALLRGGGDFATPYVASVRFFHGENPYSSSDFMSYFYAHGGTARTPVNYSGERPVYPPSSLVQDGFLVNFLVYPLLSWVILAAAVILLWSMGRETARSTFSSDGAGA